MERVISPLEVEVPIGQKENRSVGEKIMKNREDALQEVIRQFGGVNQYGISQLLQELSYQCKVDPEIAKAVIIAYTLIVQGISPDSVTVPLLR